jgi:2-amino-4-hydroxy-6-hydroxymethyldihydropteridine diphosphokinase
MGRTQKTNVKCQMSNVVYHDRIIDIDILLYDDLHIITPRLTIPHPLMYERDFVLIPLREILPQKELKQ